MRARLLRPYLVLLVSCSAASCMVCLPTRVSTDFAAPEKPHCELLVCWSVACFVVAAPARRRRATRERRSRRRWRTSPPICSSWPTSASSSCSSSSLGCRCFAAWHVSVCDPLRVIADCECYRSSSLRALSSRSLLLLSCGIRVHKLTTTLLWQSLRFRCCACRYHLPGLVSLCSHALLHAVHAQATVEVGAEHSIAALPFRSLTARVRFVSPRLAVSLAPALPFWLPIRPPSDVWVAWRDAGYPASSCFALHSPRIADRFCPRCRCCTQTVLRLLVLAEKTRAGALKARCLEFLDLEKQVICPAFSPSHYTSGCLFADCVVVFRFVGAHHACFVVAPDDCRCSTEIGRGCLFHLDSQRIGEAVQSADFKLLSKALQRRLRASAPAEALAAAAAASAAAAAAAAETKSESKDGDAAGRCSVDRSAWCFVVLSSRGAIFGFLVLTASGWFVPCRRWRVQVCLCGRRKQNGRGRRRREEAV